MYAALQKPFGFSGNHPEGAVVSTEVGAKVGAGIGAKVGAGVGTKVGATIGAGARVSAAVGRQSRPPENEAMVFATMCAVSMAGSCT